MADATVTKNETLQQALDQANPNKLADALGLVDLATMLDPVKVTFAGLTAAVSHDITTAASRAGATINRGLKALGALDSLPPILSVVALRVTGGAVLGPRAIADASPAATATGLGGAPGGVAALSDDGKTITFEAAAAVTGFVLEYIPRSKTDFATKFAPDTKA